MGVFVIAGLFMGPASVELVLGHPLELGILAGAGWMYLIAMVISPGPHDC